MSNAHIIKAKFLKTQVDGAVRNVGLDVVRGICVFLIILAHTNNILKAYTSLYRVLYPLGEMAQDLFFALSGYLIGGQILKMATEQRFGKKELLGFYLKRWIRTLPFYFIFLILNLALFHFIYRPFGPGFLKTGFPVFPYFVFLQNFFGPHPPFFAEIWPVPVEEWSYLLLPLPFLFFSPFFKSGNTFRRKLAYLIVLILIVQLVRVSYISVHHPETDWQLRKIVVYRLDALSYGFILALLIKSVKIKNQISRHSSRIFMAGIMLLMAGLFFHKFLSQDTYNMLLFVYQPFACTLLLPFFIFHTFKPGPFSALITHLSLTGYAILLSHLYCLQFLFLTFFPVDTFWSATYTTFVYLTVLIIFSTLFYNWVERPVLLLRKR